MGFTDYGKNNMLESLLKDQQVYIGLHTNLGEVKASEYERQELNFAVAENGQIVSNEDIFFPIAQSVWGEITTLAIYDGQNNILAESAPEWIKKIDAGSQYHIPAGMAIARLI